MTDGEWEIRGPDGTEYEITGGPAPSLAGEFTLLIRPKRKQRKVWCDLYINKGECSESDCLRVFRKAGVCFVDIVAWGRCR